MFEEKILSVQRKCHSISLKKNKTLIDSIYIKIVGSIYQSYLAFFYNSYIPIGAKLGVGIRFHHSFHNIFISEHCSIGDYSIILQNTTIGSNQPVSNDAPHIGNNVFIGANCNIIGDVHIGNNSIVGAGTTIAKGDFESGSIIVSQNCRVINK